MMKNIYKKPVFEVIVVELHTLMGVDASGKIDGGNNGNINPGGEGSDDPNNPDDADVNKSNLWDEF